MRILLLGPQGSGKSTQARLLAEKLNVPYIASGAILRSKAKENTPLGRRIRSLQEQGVLVDDETTIAAVKKSLQRPEFEKGFIADGFPRNIAQAREFSDFNIVFYLKLSEREAIRRLSARRICEKCEANFNFLSQPPKSKGVCDYCGGGLIQREDDKPAAIRERLAIYRKETEPVLDFFRKKGILEEVDGERGIKEIHQDILARLNQ